MTKDILRDKFSKPIILTLFLGLYTVNSTRNWLLFFTLLLISLIFLGLASYLKNDFYIENINFDSEQIKIESRRNFSQNIYDNFDIILESIDSVDFNSKSLLNPFHKISIRYMKEKGLYGRKTFKTNDDKSFIELIYILKNKI